MQRREQFKSECAPTFSDDLASYARDFLCTGCIRTDESKIVCLETNSQLLHKTWDNQREAQVSKEGASRSCHLKTADEFNAPVIAQIVHDNISHHHFNLLVVLHHKLFPQALLAINYAVMEEVGCPAVIDETVGNDGICVEDRCCRKSTVGGLKSF